MTDSQEDSRTYAYGISTVRGNAHGTESSSTRPEETLTTNA